MDLDVLAPRSVRSPLITLSLALPTVRPTAFVAVPILVTPTGAALTSGLSLPLQVSVTSPSSKVNGTPTYIHVYRRVVPSTISFIPREGGAHLVVLKELAHCRWFGTLIVQVAGDPLDVPD